MSVLKKKKILNCVKVIIHELEHVKQAVDVKAEDKDDIKTQIIKLCDRENGLTYYCMRNFTKDGQFEEFEKKLKSSELSFSDRLFLGLHLSQEEIDSIAKYRSDLSNGLTSKGWKTK